MSYEINAIELHNLTITTELFGSLTMSGESLLVSKCGFVETNPLFTQISMEAVNSIEIYNSTFVAAGALQAFTAKCKGVPLPPLPNITGNAYHTLFD